MVSHHYTIPLVSLLCLLLPVPTLSQTAAEQKLQSKANAEKTNEVSEAGSLEAQRRVFGIALVTSLASEARTYPNLALRANVLSRAADTVWNADNDTARTLFRLAWEAAELGDADEVTGKLKGDPPPTAIALKRMSGRDLRSDVVGLAARRDRALGEEFLAKLKDETKRELAESTKDLGAGNYGDNWSGSEVATKRLLLARNLLDVGQVERALEFAAPLLTQVNVKSIGFLSALREKSPDLADQRFAFLLARVELDPSSDANTISILSSYAFTPALYVTFRPDGSPTWYQDQESSRPPNLQPMIRKQFFQAAANVLLRPLLPPDQDHTTSGRLGKFMVIKRLLPLFDQYAPNVSTGLRSQLAAFPSDIPENAPRDSNSLLTKDLQADETSVEALQKMQDRLDRAKTSQERDSIYADAAVTLGNQGDVRAQDVADKIDSANRRVQVRSYVDLKFVQLAIGKKDGLEAGRLAKAGQLTHPQRVWAYVQAARLLMNSQRLRALEFLEAAAAEGRRIDGGDPDRARSLIGVATQLVTADRARAWEIMGEAIKSANSADEFTGDAVQFTFPLMTKSGLRIISLGAEDFSLSGLLRLLTKEDSYRALDLAKTFKNQAPRAIATLAIASALLER